MATFAIPPIDGWSRADQLSLFQSAVGLAGFGGAVGGLFFAGRAIAERYGRPELVITIDPEPLDIHQPHAAEARRNTGPASPLERKFSIEIFNVGRALAQSWQLRIDVDPPFTIWQESGVGEVDLSHDRRTLMHHRQSPLFADSNVVVGILRILAHRGDYDGTSDTYPFRVTATVPTEFGEDIKVFDGKVIFDR